MTWANCRGCGRVLRSEDIDGLCIATEGILGCTQRCLNWAKRTEQWLRIPKTPFGVSPIWRSPEWAVAIDQWLEAGTP